MDFRLAQPAFPKHSPEKLEMKGLPLNLNWLGWFANWLTQEAALLTSHAISVKSKEMKSLKLVPTAAA
jgi:hypothetical protein